MSMGSGALRVDGGVLVDRCRMGRQMGRRRVPALWQEEPLVDNRSSEAYSVGMRYGGAAYAMLSAHQNKTLEHARGTFAHTSARCCAEYVCARSCSRRTSNHRQFDAFVHRCIRLHISAPTSCAETAHACTHVHTCTHVCLQNIFQEPPTSTNRENSHMCMSAT